MCSFFRRKPEGEPPTEKQVKYAAKLGIPVTPKTTKAELSAAISAAERANPALRRQREHIVQESRVKKYGEEAIACEKKWNEFAETTEFLLAVYKWRNEVVVDVLRVNGADINNRGVVTLEVEAPKLRKDRYLGQYLDWDRHFLLPANALLYCEALHKDFGDPAGGLDPYKRAVERGLNTAKRL